MERHSRTADSSQLADRSVYLLMAVALGTLEYFLPRIPFIPWLKPGLANIITMIWLMKYGYRDTLLFILLKLSIVYFYFGFSFITAAIGMSGNFLSVTLMHLVLRVMVKRNYSGMTGLGIAGALAHNAGQLIMVYLLLASNRMVFYQLPFMIVAALIFGTINGLLVLPVWYKVEDRLKGHPKIKDHQTETARISSSALVSGLLLLAGCLGLVFVHEYIILGGLALLSAIFVQVFCGPSLRRLFYPLLSFWPFFLITAFFNLANTYGVKVGHIPWITWEGLGAAARQSLKLWTWLMVTQLLTRLDFNRTFFLMLRRVFPGREAVLAAGMQALSLFPAVISRIRADFRSLVFKRGRLSLLVDRILLLLKQ